MFSDKQTAVKTVPSTTSGKARNRFQIFWRQ